MNDKPIVNSDQNSKPVVDLVGAGCHDASWLTAAAKEAIARADIVIYDDLVDESIVNCAHPKAQRIYRGKRGHLVSADQREINQLLVDEALDGKKVIRLKGGDPMIFGRGMEEVEFLEAHGISVRVLPGISSFYGIPSKEAFGLTKRAQAAGFMVLTAHNAKQPRTRTEWKQIAGFQGTLVFLMGMADLDSIRQNLIEAGLDPQTPCAIFTSPVFTMTTSIKTSLGLLAKSAEENRLKSPGIIVIGGSVASYSPLNPIRIALGGSEDFNAKLSALLPPDMQSASLLRYEYTDFEIDLSAILDDHPDWLVFTSPHGADRFLSLLSEEHRDLRSLASMRIACIGKGTARRFEQALIIPDLVASGSDSAFLALELANQVKDGDHVVLMQSQKALPTLRDQLAKRTDVKTDFVALYDFACRPGRALEADLEYDYLVLPSRTAAKCWSSLRKRPRVKTIIALSEAIASLVSDLDSEVLISPHPQAQEVARLLITDALSKEKSESSPTA